MLSTHFRKMRMLLVFTISFGSMFSCNQMAETSTSVEDSTLVHDTVDSEKQAIRDEEESIVKEDPQAQAFSNARFRNVSVTKTGDNTFQVKGQAQVFEANISWVVEDGHNELKKGFETTSAGAPAWGDFNFTLQVAKDRPNSTLHLILFEASAKDGSRQHTLPIPLPH